MLRCRFSRRRRWRRRRPPCRRRRRRCRRRRCRRRPLCRSLCRFSRRRRRRFSRRRRRRGFWGKLARQKFGIRPIRGVPTEDQMSSCLARFFRWIPTCGRSMGARVSRIRFWENWPAKSSGFGRFVGPNLRQNVLMSCAIFVGFQLVTDRWVRVCPESDSGKIGPPKVQDLADLWGPN